jgi:1,4-dihydroxy-2-naphthoate octaprenyltransferase
MAYTSIEKISKIDSWILASRPKTLLAAVVPVLVGSALAFYDDSFQPVAAIFALMCSVLIQVGTNFTNDLYDFMKGADRKDRYGPHRALASGWLTVNEMKIAVILTFSIAFLLGMYLVYLGGIPILIIGILSILAGLAYTAGPYPLAYNGLGDIFVFLFFGLIGTTGTFYVQTMKVTYLVFWSSIPVGALITNILVVNNYRDTDEDRIAGKKTLAVIFGKRFARYQYIFFMIVSYLIPLVVYFTFKQNIWVFLPLLTFPISFKLVKMIFTLEGKQLNKTLELTARLSLLYGILFALGILI